MPDKLIPGEEKTPVYKKQKFGTPFTLKSGNASTFKNLGSSPVKDTNPHKTTETHTSHTPPPKKEYTEEQQTSINLGKLARWNEANPKATQDDMEVEKQRIWAEGRVKKSPAEAGLKHFTYNERPRR